MLVGHMDECFTFILVQQCKRVVVVGEAAQSGEHDLDGELEYVAGLFEERQMLL